MTNISIYDIDFEALEKKADETDTTIAEVICALCDYLEEI